MFNVSEIIDKLSCLYQHIEAWIVAAVVFCASFLGDGKSFGMYILFAVICDLILAIFRSYKKGVGIKSSGIFTAVFKIFVYLLILFLLVSFDIVIGSESLICTRAVTALILGGEIISIIASLAILFPDIKVFKLISKFVIDEIAEKLGQDPDEVKKVLEEEDKTKKKKESTEEVVEEEENTTEN